MALAYACSILSGHPSALIHLGDWVKRGRDQLEWARVNESLLAFRNLPVYTVRGNHDRGGFSRFFYGQETHPALRVIELDPFVLYLVDSEAEESRLKELIHNQLERELMLSTAERPDIQKERAKIWVQHRPIWSSGNHGVDERSWRSWLVPALRRLKIDLMIAGHDHDYERFCPSLGIDELRRCDRGGVTYLISGGGASVTVPLPGLSWRQRSDHREQNSRQRIIFSDAPHHLELSVHQGELKVEAISSTYLGDRSRIDGFKIALKKRAPLITKNILDHILPFIS